MLVELNIVSEIFVEKPEQWVNHRRSKNYIAHITGFDMTYGLKRDFLKRERVGRNSYFLLKDFIEGEIYEIKCIYYTGSGHPHPELDGLFLCKGVKDGKVILEEISSEDAANILKDKYPETVEISREEAKVAELQQLKIEREERLRELEKAKEALELEIPDIDEKEVREVREKLKERIREVSSMLIEFGGVRYGKKVYDRGGIKITDRYVKVGSVYLISEYDSEPSLSALADGYRKLVDRVWKEKERVKEIKNEIS